MNWMFLLSVLLAEPIPVALPTRSSPVSYAREVADVLGAKCVGCHNEALAENRLSLEDVPAMVRGGKAGPALVPGKADESLLFQMAAHRVEPAMPPREKKDQEPLTPEELGLLKLWIDAGAPDDSDSAEFEAAEAELGTLPPGLGPIVAVDLTADGRTVAAGRGSVVEVFDADSGLPIVALDGGHRDIIQSLRFDPAGRRLAAGSYRLATLWEAPEGGPLVTFAGHDDQVAGLAARDGTLTSGGLDRTVRIWDASGKVLRKFDLPAALNAVAVAPGGRRVAAGGADGRVYLLDLDGPGEPRALQGHGGPVIDLLFLPDGRRIVSASEDGSARVFEWAGTTRVVLARHEGAVRAVALLAGGRIITAGDDATIRAWGEDGSPVGRFHLPGGAVRALAASPDGRELLAGSDDGSARRIDAATGSVLATLPGHRGAVRAVAWSAAGDRVATAGEEGGVKVWEAGTGVGVVAFGHLPPKEGPTRPILRVAFLDGGTIATASADGTLRSWSFRGSWRLARAWDEFADRVLALAFNPDGTLLAAAGGEPARSGELKVFETTKGFRVRSFDGLHADTIFGVEWSPDGGSLATAGADRMVKVVRLSGPIAPRTLEGHTHHALGLAWKPDGSALASVGADDALKFWDPATGEQARSVAGSGKQLTAIRWVAQPEAVVVASGDGKVRAYNPAGQAQRTFEGLSGFVSGLAASADGRRVAAGDPSGVLHVWDASDVRLLHQIKPAIAPR